MLKLIEVKRILLLFSLLLFVATCFGQFPGAPTIPNKKINHGDKIQRLEGAKYRLSMPLTDYQLDSSGVYSQRYVQLDSIEKYMLGSKTFTFATIADTSTLTPVCGDVVRIVTADTCVIPYYVYVCESNTYMNQRKKWTKVGSFLNQNCFRLLSDTSGLGGGSGDTIGRLHRNVGIGKGLVKVSNSNVYDNAAFKSISSPDGSVDVTEDANNIYLITSGGNYSFINIGSGAYVIKDTLNRVIKFRSMLGSGCIKATVSGDAIIFQDTCPRAACRDSMWKVGLFFHHRNTDCVTQITKDSIGGAGAIDSLFTSVANSSEFKVRLDGNGTSDFSIKKGNNIKFTLPVTGKNGSITLSADSIQMKDSLKVNSWSPTQAQVALFSNPSGYLNLLMKDTSKLRFSNGTLGYQGMLEFEAKFPDLPQVESCNSESLPLVGVGGCIKSIQSGCGINISDEDTYLDFSFDPCTMVNCIPLSTYDYCADPDVWQEFQMLGWDPTTGCLGFMPMPASSFCAAGALPPPTINSFPLDQNIIAGGTLNGRVLTYDNSVSKWVGKPQISLANQQYSATAGQTLFTLSNTSVGDVAVYINGLLADTSLFVTTPTTVTYTGSAFVGGERINITYSK